MKKINFSMKQMDLVKTYFLWIYWQFKTNPPRKIMKTNSPSSKFATIYVKLSLRFSLILKNFKHLLTWKEFIKQKLSINHKYFSEVFSFIYLSITLTRSILSHFDQPHKILCGLWVNRLKNSSFSSAEDSSCFDLRTSISIQFNGLIFAKTFPAPNMPVWVILLLFTQVKF